MKKIISTFALCLFCSVCIGQSKNINPWGNRHYYMNAAEIPIAPQTAVKEFNAIQLEHDIGFKTDSALSVQKDKKFTNLMRGTGGYLAKGALFENPGIGGGRVVFRAKINDNSNGVWDKIMKLEVHDINTSEIISYQEIERNFFRNDTIYQNFVLHFDLKGREHHTLEAKVWYLGNADIEIQKITYLIDPAEKGLPKILNESSAKTKHVELLIKEAIKGLGFDDSTLDGPNIDDLVYINDYYIAWIDQTGFYGKMNGLWILNREKGGKLNFVPESIEKGRVVNFLTVAEEGNGNWPGSYMGAEHYEIPGYVKENDDNSTPVEKGISNWYTVNEASLNKGTGGLGHIPWWTCCSGVKNNKQSFGQINPPSEFDFKENQLKIRYMAPITKGVDADGLYDGDRCQANMLFFNNIRYPLYLKLSYIFYKDKPYFERTYQIFNPEGNTTLPVNTYMALIHGILITNKSYKIPWKGKMFSYIKSNSKINIFNKTNEYEDPKMNSWAKLDIGTDLDLIGGTASPNASFYISDNKSLDVGHSFFYTLFGEKTSVSEGQLYKHDGNISYCKCVVHGDWEFGGGLLVNDTPIPAGNLALKQ